MSQLPPVFQFSQNNLQDYVDCPRRFQLRYVVGQRWPAIESEPLLEYEHLLEQGEHFHLLVQRHILGIPAERLMPDKPLLAQWWENYLNSPPPDLPTGKRLPELQLSTPIDEQRLMAKFDLVALDPGERAVIVDWKTGQRRPGRWLDRRLQSRVYPYVLVEAGTHLFGGPITPERVSMVYWFAEAPNNPEILRYTAEQHAVNHDSLRRLIEEIIRRGDEEWDKTETLDHCKYCVYRSLCDRGVRAGALEEVGLEALDWKKDFDFDLDSVEEIAF